MAPTKILLTGATGYIGGTVLDALLSSKHPSILNSTITCLVRGDDRAAALRSLYGPRVQTVTFHDLNDTAILTQTASIHDLAINTADGFHPSCARALIAGLAQRTHQIGSQTLLLHTSGTSNLADQPVTKAFLHDEGERVFSDEYPSEITLFECEREAVAPYGQRTTELGALTLAHELGVRALAIMSPLVFGRGAGAFNKGSVQLPMWIRGTVREGRAVCVGDGMAEWDHVHVRDLAELYVCCVVDFLEHKGAGLPATESGVVFSANGRHRWAEAARRIAEVCFEAGKIESKEVQHVGLEEGATFLGWPAGIVELAFASNSRTEAVVGRERLRWKPVRGEEAWEAAFKEDLELVLQEQAK